MLPSSVFARLKAKKAPLDGTIHSSEILDAIPDDASPSEFSGCFSYLNEREHLWAKPRLPEWCKKLERNLVRKCQLFGLSLLGQFSSNTRGILPGREESYRGA